MKLRPDDVGNFVEPVQVRRDLQLWIFLTRKQQCCFGQRYGPIRQSHQFLKRSSRSCAHTFFNQSAKSAIESITHCGLAFSRRSLGIRVRDTKARYAGRVRRLDTTKRIFHSGTVLWFEISAALLQPVTRKLKRLRVRLASLDIFCRDDRREALQESSCTQNVTNLADPRPGSDPDWTAARGGTYRVCGALKQDVFPLDRAEVVNALALDQLDEFCFPQLECVLLPQLLKTVAIVQR